MTAGETGRHCIESTQMGRDELGDVYVCVCERQLPGVHVDEN